MINSTIIRNINEKLFIFSLFALPFKYEISSIAIFGVFTLSCYDVIKNKKNVFNTIKNSIIFFFAYFIIEILGLFYSENLSFGLKDVESKLFFVICPFIFLANRFEEKTLNKSYLLFIASTIITLIIHFLFGINYYIKYSSIPNHVNFAFLMHPAYYSIYLITSVLLTIKLKKENIIKNNILFFILLLLLSFGIVLSNSKSGTITYIIIFIYFIVNQIKKQRKNYLLYFMIVITFISVSILVVNKIKYTRFSELKSSSNFPIQKEYSGEYNSTQERVIIWRSAKQVIINNLFFGTGTGDTKDELKKEFKKVNFQNGIKKNYNYHNQYLQIIATFGVIFGGTILVFFFYSIFKELNNKNYFFIIFNMIIAFNLLFESMFESKAGIELIVLFYCCFLFSFEKNIVNHILIK